MNKAWWKEHMASKKCSVCVYNVVAIRLWDIHVCMCPCIGMELQKYWWHWPRYERMWHNTTYRYMWCIYTPKGPSLVLDFLSCYDLFVPTSTWHGSLPIIYYYILILSIITKTEISKQASCWPAVVVASCVQREWATTWTTPALHAPAPHIWSNHEHIVQTAPGTISNER